jgi:hypothetical protein
VERHAVGSSFTLVRDPRRGTWILAYPTDESRLFLPFHRLARDQRVESPRLIVTRRRPNCFGPCVVLALTIAAAALLHALH